MDMYSKCCVITYSKYIIIFIYQLYINNAEKNNNEKEKIKATNV